MKDTEMEDVNPKMEESSLEEDLFGDSVTAPNTLSQPSIGVQAAIIKRLLDATEM
jgi:hypothetical protein